MSAVNHQLKSVFIHNPKTAGTSMEIMQWVGGNGHARLCDIDAPSDYLAWCFVRHPVDRFVSAYFSLCETSDEFAERYPDPLTAARNLDTYDMRTRNHMMPQWLFTNGCRFIGRFETLQQDFERLRHLIGAPKSRLLRLNPTKCKRVIDYETRRIVCEFYDIDFRVFGYERVFA